MLRYLAFALLFLPLASTAGPATGPEPVYPITEVIKPLDYYQEQAELWQQITQQSPDRTDGWWNWYLAARNIMSLQGNSTYDLRQIVAGAEAAIPDSFERYYMAYCESPQEGRRFDLLLRAHEVSPDRPEALQDLMAYYELQQDAAKLDHYCRSWLQKSSYSPGILDWNYNMLMSVEPNGILLTQGDNDTYPAWVLQRVHHIRPDVRVLNAPLLLFHAAYRERIFGELHIPQWTHASDTEHSLSNLYRHIFHHAARPVYLTIGTGNPQQFGPDLFFITGLAIRYSTVDFDNLTSILANYEQRFRLDALRYNFQRDPGQSVVDQINMNYVPSMVLLTRHYMETGAGQKAETIRELALQIGEKAGQGKAVAAHFKIAEEPAFFSASIDIRPVQKAMQPVGDKLYASATEVSNQEYELFLKDLLSQRQFDLLDKCKIHPVDWRSLLPAGLQALSDEALYSAAGHPDGPEMPVVNITYEAALIYCDWLTRAYNQSTDRRKQFKKVRFRLPTEAEWERAARGGREKTPYPWGGYYVKNSKGCYLANVNPYLNVYDQEAKVFTTNQDAESPGEDSAYFPAKVDTYFPNDFHLYNMSGNIAEMVAEKDFTKGGSWLEPLYYAQIGSQHFQPTPSPAVGFRIFMEVIEEK